MNQAQAKAVRLLELPDRLFAEDATSERDALIVELSPDDDELEGDAVEPILALGIPAEVDLERNEHIPVLMAKRWTGLRTWEVDIEQNLTWIVSDLRSGRVKAVCPLPLDKRRMETPPPSRTPPEPSDVDRLSVTYGIEHMGLPAVFGKDWPSDRYAGTLAVHDWVSNTVVFAVEHERPPWQSYPEVILAPSPFVKAVSPPDAETSPRVAFSVRGAAKDAATVSGMLSVPIDSVVLAKSAVDGSLLLPAAVVLLQLDSTTPIQVELAIPASIAGETVVADFSANLGEPLANDALSGEYVVYFVVGQLVSGPEILHLD